jgi:hypothetical protein
MIEASILNPRISTWNECEFWVNECIIATWERALGKEHYKRASHRPFAC